MIPRFKADYGIEEWKAAFRIFSQGNIEKYERQFAAKFECEYGIMFGYGRSGLYALFDVWDLQDTEIICPAYTCVVVPHAIVLSGNRPVFIDSADGHFNMDLDQLEKAITPRTRAIIATHLFGYPLDVNRVNEIALRASENYGHKVYVVQDCAHSYGAKWKGQLVTKFGDAAIFGSNISKIINSIFGGMVTTQNQETNEKLRHWKRANLIDNKYTKTLSRLAYFVAVNVAFHSAVYGFIEWLNRNRFLDYFTKYYTESSIDFPKDWNTEPTEIEARIGLVQLSKYDNIIAERAMLAQEVIMNNAGPDFEMLPYDPECTYSHIVAKVKDRTEVVKYYKNRGIELGILIEYCIPYMKAYQKYKNPNSNYEVSRNYSDSLINFPTVRT